MTTDLVSPWVPDTSPSNLKHLGKLGEECGELSAVISRCIIQGINEKHPITGKLNKEWLEEEIADVFANMVLVIQKFKLNEDNIVERQNKKMALLKAWHEMLEIKEYRYFNCQDILTYPERLKFSTHCFNCATSGTPDPRVK